MDFDKFEEIYEEGYVETIHPDLLEELVDALAIAYESWRDAPESTIAMRPWAKADLLNFLKNKLDQM